MANRIDFTIGYTVDKTGLNELSSSLKQVTETASNMNVGGLDDQLSAAASEANQLNSILNQSWNSKLNQLDLSAFNAQMQNVGLSMSKLKSDFESVGPEGSKAFNELSSAILSTNLELKESNQFLNNMATTMANTAKWQVTSQIMNKITGSIQQAWSFAKNLDTSLNNIQIVTSKSRDDMQEFAEYANQAAKSLGASTLDYTNASLIYYQQGLSDEEVNARTDVTLKAANITKQSASEVADELTAVWNGYQVTAENAEASIDILAAVAANTASNLEELATGMTKVASAANAMGVGESELAAQISTIVSATRQAPESVGQALKTVYARMSTISAGGTDEDDGATLTSYTAKMNKFGISVLDANGHLRDMGDVIEEIGSKWDDFSREQQVTIAQTMAGTRQYNNLLALFENWDQYTRTLDIANNSLGTLQEQQDIYMESTAAHLQQLSTSAERMYNTLFDTATINKFIDAFSGILNVLGNFLDSLGGGMQSFMGLGVMVANIFSNQIGGAIEKQIENSERLAANQKALELVQQEADRGVATAGLDQATIDAYTAEKERAQEILEIQQTLSSEEYNRLTDLNTEITQQDLILAKAEDIIDIAAGAEDFNEKLKEQQIEINKEITDTTLQLQEQNNIYKTISQQRSALKGLSREEFENSQQGVQIQSQVTSLLESEILSEKTKTELRKTQNNYANGNSSIEEYINNVLKAQQSNIQGINVQLQNQKATQEAIKQVMDGTIDSTRAMNEANKHAFNADMVQQDRTNTIQATTKSITALAMGINSLRNAISILRNDDLTGWEKFGQILSNLVFTVPMLISSISSVAKSLPSVAHTLENVTGAGSSAAETAQTQAHTAATIADTIAEENNTNSKVDNTTKTTANTTAKITNTAQVALESTALEGSKLSTEAETTAIDLNTKSILKNVDARTKLQLIQFGKDNNIDLDDFSQTSGGIWVPSNKKNTNVSGDIESTKEQVTKLNDELENGTPKAHKYGNSLASIKNSLGAIGSSIAGYLPQIAAVTAVIGAVVAICVVAYNAYTKDARAAEQAAQAAQELADTNDAVADSLANINSAIDTYDSAKEKLDDCVKGTQEWRDALKETNDAALDLIDTVGNLSGDTIRNAYNTSTGEFDQGVLDQIQAQAETQANAAAIAAAQGQYNSAVAEGNADILSSVRSNVLLYDEYGTSANTTNKAVRDALMEAFKNGDVEDAEQTVRDVLDDLGVSCAKGDDSISALAKACENYASSVDSTAARLELQVQTTVDEALGVEEGNEAERSLTSDLITAQINSQVESITAELDKTFSKGMGSNSSKYQGLIQELNARGFEFSSTKNGVRGSDDNRYFYFLDEATQEVVKYSTEWVASTIASYDALNDLTGSAETAAGYLNSIRGYGEANENSNLADAWLGFIQNGNFDDLSMGNVDAMKEFIGENGENVRENLIDMLGISEDEADEIFQTLFGEDYQNSIQQALKDFEVGVDGLTDGMRRAVQDAAQALHLQDRDLSLTQANTIVRFLEDTLDYIGEDTFKSFNDIFSDLSDAQLANFSDLLNNLDWDTVGVDDLRLALLELDNPIDLDTGLLVDLCDALNKLGGAVGLTTEELYENYKDITSIIDGLQKGDTISSENYGKIVEQLGDAAGTYFSRTLTGEYQMTGNANDFSAMSQDILISGFQGQESDLLNQIDQYQQLAQGLEEFTYRNNDELYDLVTTYQNLNGEVLISQQELGQLYDDTLSEVPEIRQAAYEQLHELRDQITQSAEETDGFSTSIAELESQLFELDHAIALSYDSLDELKEAYEGNKISAEAYTFAEEQLYEASRMENLDTDAVQDYAKYLQHLSKTSEELSPNLADNDDAAQSMAVSIMRMNNGVEELNDNWEDWSDILKNSSKESYEYWEALEGTAAALSDLLDISQDYFNDDFMIDHMEDISLAANGDADAIDRLRAATLDSIIIDIQSRIDTNEELNINLSERVAELQDMLDEMPLDIESQISDPQGTNEFLEACNAMILEAGMTADEVNELFSGMGYDVTFATEPQSVTTTIPHYLEHYNPIDTGEEINVGTDEHPEMRKLYNIEHWTEQLESTSVEGDVTAYAMQTSEPGTTVVPAINSITKKPSGSANNYSSKNSGGTKLGNTSSGSSGSSGSTSEPKQEDHIEDEIDRYHDINLELQAISTNLSRLQTQESKLVGQSLLDNLNAQLDTLDDYIDATTRKIAIATDEAQEYRDKLASQGVTFDENGYITNYASIMQSQLAYVNAEIDKYNAMTAEQQEAYQDTLDKVKQDYQDFVDMISDYDTLISETIPGLEDDIQDALDQEIELQIEKFTMEVEIRLDMSEAEKDWDEFYRKVVLGLSDDDILGNATQDLADILSYFNTTAADITDLSADNINDWLEQIANGIASAGTGSIQALTQQVNDTLDQLAQMDSSGWASVYGDNRSQALEDLQTYYTELMNQLEDVEDLVEDIKDSYLDMIDEAIDAFDEQIDQYEYINDLLEHDMELVGLLYGDEAYSQMAIYYQKIEDNNNAELDFLRKRVDYAKAMMDAETDDEARKKWQEEWEDALEQLNDKVEESIDNLIDKYTNLINDVINQMNDAVTSGLGLDYVSTQWDLMTDASDRYLDTINALYSIQDLQTKYLDAIDATDSISAQQKLNDVMAEQIAYLEEKDYLTQYDVDRANMIYEITLKQIALEEAQQNKSTMRLRRDSQGNYTYQYVSDENAVADAQAELLDLQNQLYNFDKDAYKQNLSDLYDVYNDYQNALLQLYEDQTLSAEERERYIADIVEYYGGQINQLCQDNETIRTNLVSSATDELAALYGVDVENFTNMTDAEIDALMESLIPQWDSAIQHMVDTIVEEGGFAPTCEEAFEALDQALADYETDLDELADAAGIDFGEIAEGYDEVIEAAQDLLVANDDLIAQYDDQIRAIQNVISQLDDLIAQYQAAEDAAIAATNAAYAYWQQEQSNNAAAASNSSSSSASASSSSSSKSSSSSSSGSSSSSSSSSSSKDNSAKAEGVAAAIWINGSSASGWGQGSTRKNRLAEKGVSDAQTIINEKAASGELYSKWHGKDLTGYYYGAFDTGGYTGDWEDGSGRLAILHSKELVLNRADTDNILSAVSLVRDMSSMMNALDNQTFSKIASLMTGLSNIGVNYESGPEQIEQDVHIEASFPNVQKSQEIEQAFTNLVNIAAQHAFNTRR